MRDVDVIVAGAGPAGLLVGVVFAHCGFRIALVDPNAGAPGSQAGHVHLLSDETWAGMCELLPGLVARAVHYGAPVAPSGAAMLEGELGADYRAWPDRSQLDRALFDCVVSDLGLPVVYDRIGHIHRRGGRWYASGFRAGWLVDATGGARATLRAAAGLGNIEWMEWGDRRSYASLVLLDVAWPDNRVGYGSRADDGSGLVLRRISARETLVTLQLERPENLPQSHGAFFDRIADIASPKIYLWIRRGLAASDIRKWTSRRSSAVLADAGLAAFGWMAVGDALLNTAPHRGQGLAQIVQQAQLIGEALHSEQNILVAASRLTAWADQRLIAVTLSEQLGGSDAVAA